MKWFILLTIIGYQGDSYQIWNGKSDPTLGKCLERATSDDFRSAVIEMYKDKGIQMVQFHCVIKEGETGA